MNSVATKIELNDCTHVTVMLQTFQLEKDAENGAYETQMGLPV